MVRYASIIRGSVGPEEGDVVQVEGSHSAFTRVCRLLGLVLLILLIGVLLAGCTTVTATSTFEVNGDATHSLALVIPRDAVPPVDMPRLQQALDDAQQRAVEDGLTFQRVDTPTQLGINMSSSTKDAVDTAAALNSLVNSLLGSPDTGPIALFQGTYERTNPAVGGNEFDLKLTIRGEAIHSAFERVLPAASLDRDPENIVSISYTATMPGKIRATNGEKLNDSTVRWTIPLYGDTTMEATSTVGKDTPWALLVLTVIGAVAIVSIVTLVVTRLLIARRRAQREMALQSTRFAPVDLWPAIGRAVRRAIYGPGMSRRAPPAAENQEMLDGTDTKRD
jgi:hypothetical protein